MSTSFLEAFAILLTGTSRRGSVKMSRACWRLSPNSREPRESRGSFDDRKPPKRAETGGKTTQFRWTIRRDLWGVRRLAPSAGRT